MKHNTPPMKAIQLKGIITLVLTATMTWWGTTATAQSYDVTWRDMVYANTATTNVLDNDHPNNSLWASGATSTNMLHPDQDGWVEYIAVGTGKNKAIGLSVYPDHHYDKDNIHYGVVLVAGGNLDYTESGSGANLTTYANGDTIRIERINDTIYYKLNGTTQRTLAVDSMETLVVDAAFKTKDAQFEHVKCSSPAGYDIQFDITNLGTVDGTEGEIDMTVAGETSPYTYVWEENRWSMNFTSQDIDTLGVESYIVTVTDNNSRSMTRTIGVGYDVEWRNMTQCDTIANATILNNTNTSASWLTGASSTNTLYPNENGWVEYTVASTNKNKAFGFTVDASHDYDWDEIDYGFYMGAYNMLYATESGTNTFISHYDLEDVLRVERDGDFVYYKRNGTTLRITAAPATETMVVDASMATKDGDFEHVRCSFPPGFKLSATVTNAVAGNTPLGGDIDLTVEGAASPYTYSWSPSAHTEQDPDSLEVAVHTITVSDRKKNTVQRQYSVGYNVQWENLVLCDTNQTGVLDNNTASSSLWNSGASSTNVLHKNNDGWVEYQVVSTNKVKVLGFSTYDNQGHAWTEMKYGLYFGSLADLYYTQSGTTTFLSNYSKNDVVRIERVADTMYYQLNGTTLHSHAVSTEEALIVDASFKTTNGDFEYVRASFLPYDVRATYTQCDYSLYEPYKAFITIEPTGFKPFTYSWNTGATTATIDSLAAGNYSVTVKDSLNSDSVTFDFVVGSELDLVDLVGATYENGVLTKTAADGYGNAGASAQNFIAADEEGALAMEVADTTSELALGLSDSNPDEKYDSTLYAAVIDDGVLYTYIKGHTTGTLPVAKDASNDTIKVQAGDWIKVERDTTGSGNNQKIQFTYNGYAYYTYSDTGQYRDLVVDIALGRSGAKINRLVGTFTEGKVPQTLDCDARNKRNSYTTYIYDGSGNVVGETHQFLDRLGRLEQTQTNDFENNLVLVNQTVFDQHGRSILQTLPAPVYKGSTNCYKYKFITNPSGQQYSYNDFDLTNKNGDGGEAFNPLAVNNVVKSSVGWYYSNNNSEEAFVAATTHPYSRVEYHHDPLGRPKAIAGVGEHHAIGSNHETKLFYVGNAYELRYIFGSAVDEARKTVTVDAEGLTQITYTNLEGHPIATAFSGLTHSCGNKLVKRTLEYSGTRSVDFHLPAATNSTLKLVQNTAMGCTDVSYLTYTITDLDSGKELVAGTDYTVSGTTSRTFTFLGDYATGDHYYRFSFDYSNHYIDNVFWATYVPPATPPSPTLYYSLDYSQWTVNFYDDKGLLEKTLEPERVQCGLIPGGNNGNEDVVNHYEYLMSAYDIPNDEFDVGQSMKDLTITGNGQPLVAQYISLKPMAWAKPIDVPVDNDGLLIYGANDICDTSTVTFDAPTDVDPRGGLISDIVEYLGGDVPVGIALDDKSIGLTSALAKGGFKQEDPYGGQVNPDCELLLHCFNGIQDCNETAVDIGGNCQNTSCFQVPPHRFATYRYVFELVGVNGGSETAINDADGNPVEWEFTPELYQTCACEFFWAYDYGYGPEITLNYDDDLAAYSQVRVNLKSVAAKVEPDADFINIDLNKFEHELAKYFGFKLFHTYREEDHLTPVAPPVTPDHQTVFAYNDLLQLTSSNNTDEGLTEYVYDTQGQLRFSQNAQQAIDDHFSYTHYDRYGRVVETGEYQSTSSNYLFQNDAGTYTITSPNRPVTDVLDKQDGLEDQFCYDQNFTVYDSVDASPGWPGALSGYAQTYVLGRVSKTWNDESTTWYSYDELGRLRWTIQHLAGLNDYKTVQYTYDFNGNLLQTNYQEEVSAEAFYHHYEYDANLRLTNVTTSEDGVVGTADQRAAYDYYQHGALKRTEIDDQLQGIDYVYTINGWLKGINAPDMDNRDPGLDGYTSAPTTGAAPRTAHNSFEKDVFGFTIDYFSGDYQRQHTYVQTMDLPKVGGGHETGQYNGNIKSIRWRTRSELNAATPEHEGSLLAYTYEYDALNRLTDAEFGTISNNGSQNANIQQAGTYEGPTFANSNDFKVSGITYDLNGNIESLERDGNSTSGLAMDDLDYHYNTLNNQLTYVSDAVGSVSYDDIESQGTSNYTYNAIGQVTGNAKDDDYFEYDVYGMVTTIKQQGGTLKAAFVYDENGNRAIKKIYDGSGNIEKEIFYVRDAAGNVLSVYEQTHPGGTPSGIGQTDVTIYGASRIGFFNKDDDKSRYELTDHIGNVRAVIDGALDGNGDVQLLDMNDFYPYGMPLPGRSITGSPAHQYTVGGQERLENSAYIDFPLRQYDPRIGRWLNPDPLGQHISPYLAMSNNPVSFIDPTGGNDEAIHDDDGMWNDGGGWSIQTLWLLSNFDGSYEEMAAWMEKELGFGFSNERGEFGYYIDYNGVLVRDGKYSFKSFAAVSEWVKLNGAKMGMYFYQNTIGAYNRGIDRGAMNALEGSADFIAGFFTGESWGQSMYATNTTAAMISDPDYALQVAMTSFKAADWWNRATVNDLTFGEVGEAQGMIGSMVVESMLLSKGASMLKSTGLAKRFGNFGKLEAGEAVSASKREITVLGKYPQYIELARKLNARRFNIPTDIWNKMTPAQQWSANVKFLDRAIARGDRFVLANPVDNITKVSGYFRRELEYLIEKGYKLSKDGTQLIK